MPQKHWSRCYCIDCHMASFANNKSLLRKWKLCSINPFYMKLELLRIFLVWLIVSVTWYLIIVQAHAYQCFCGFYCRLNSDISRLEAKIERLESQLATKDREIATITRTVLIDLIFSFTNCLTEVHIIDLKYYTLYNVYVIKWTTALGGGDMRKIKKNLRGSN